MTDRTRSTLRGTRRALLAAGALFATVFTLLALQLWLGRDPALGDGSRRAADTSATGNGTHASVLDTVLAVAAGVLDDDEGEAGPAVRSGTS